MFELVCDLLISLVMILHSLCYVYCLQPLFIHVHPFNEFCSAQLSFNGPSNLKQLNGLYVTMALNVGSTLVFYIYTVKKLPCKSLWLCAYRPTIHYIAEYFPSNGCPKVTKSSPKLWNCIYFHSASLGSSGRSLWPTAGHPNPRWKGLTADCKTASGL